MMNPAVDNQFYNDFKNSQSNTSKKCDICYKCYMQLSKYHPFSGGDIRNKYLLETEALRGTRTQNREMNVARIIQQIGHSDGQSQSFLFDRSPQNDISTQSQNDSMLKDSIKPLGRPSPKSSSRSQGKVCSQKLGLHQAANASTRMSNGQQAKNASMLKFNEE